MPETVLNILLWTVAIYISIGGLFAIPFLVWGIDKTDKAAHGSSLGFKIIIIPGIIIFWLWPLKKWIKDAKR